MFGDKHRLRERLAKHGRKADAEVLEAKERPWGNKRGGEIGIGIAYRLKLRVAPAGAPPFEATITDEWRAREQYVRAPWAGMTVTVAYDPDDHDKVVLMPPRSMAAALEQSGPPAASHAGGEDLELAALAGLDGADDAPGPPAGGSPSRLDRLQQLADLQDRGVLSAAEFAAEKAKILNEG